MLSPERIISRTNQSTRLKSPPVQEAEKARQIEDMLLPGYPSGTTWRVDPHFCRFRPRNRNVAQTIISARLCNPYLKQLVDAFPRTTKVVSSEANLQPYFDTLTERELEILSLLAQRLSNKIAGALIISEETVKRHTSNIYQKLGVNNRRQAVASAYTFGLLVDTGLVIVFG